MYLLKALTSPESEYGPIMQPIFISCDPARDTVEQTAAYVKGGAIRIPTVLMLDLTTHV